MQIITEQFSVKTDSFNQMIDITAQVQKIVTASSITNGDTIVYCPHTTAAITINENADPDVVHDLLMTFAEIFPRDRKGYRHDEGNSDGHCKSSTIGCSEQVIIADAKLLLGTWQGIYFCEFDGPRNRTVKVQVRGI